MALSACSVLPTTGPTTNEIVEAAATPETPDGLELIKIDRDVVAKFDRYRVPPLSGRFADRRPTPSATIGIGDSVIVTIFEAGSGGLFSTSANQFGTGTKSATLPTQTIGPDGQVSVPYAGRFDVVGKSTARVEAMIVERLRDKAIEPQVVVTIASSRSNLATVDGEVGTAGRIPLSPKGDRLLDVIASAGGTKGHASDLFVRLTRQGRTGKVPLRTILEDPTQNVWIWPGDQVFVYAEPQTFTVYGASGRSGTFPFTYDQFSLAEAIGTASGLNDMRAEPSGIFVYREERGEVVCAVKEEKPCVAPNALRPVVYQIDLRDPAGVALAQRVSIRNKDVVYVANAESVGIGKVLVLLAQGASLANSTSATSVRLSNN
jgi:polysaccharide export outer membrane protein